MHWFQFAKIFALTSIWEGFGNVLVQALAEGCSIVSTDCPNGPREILAKGKYGALVPVGDAAALSAAFKRVLEGDPFDPDAQKSRARDFSVKQSADNYEKLFQSLS
ncbi:4-alpha-N-acetylgalactosaminyltransferase [compost metagenome]